MVARLKLKEIDGRAPPGVNKATQLCSEKHPERGVVCLECIVLVRNGNIPKLRGTPNAHRYYSALKGPDSHNPGDVTMGNPQPLPPARIATGAVQRLNRSGRSRLLRYSPAVSADSQIRTGACGLI